MGRAGAFSWLSFDRSAGVQVSSLSTLVRETRCPSGRASSSRTGSEGAAQTAPAWSGLLNSRPRTTGPEGAHVGDSVAPLSVLQHAFMKRFMLRHTRVLRRDGVCCNKKCF